MIYSEIIKFISYLRTSVGAVEDGVASVHTVRALQSVEPFLRGFVT